MALYQFDGLVCRCVIVIVTASIKVRTCHLPSRLERVISGWPDYPAVGMTLIIVSASLARTWKKRSRHQDGVDSLV